MAKSIAGFVVVLDPDDDNEENDYSAQHFGPFPTVEAADAYGALHCEVTYRIKTLFRPIAGK